MKKSLLIFIVILLLVAGSSFYGGMKYQQSKQSTFFRQGSNGQMRAGNGDNRAAGSGFVSGEIVAKDQNSITVKLTTPGQNQSSGSKIVILAVSTEISKSVTGAAGDLAVGQTVMISGTANQDGSLTAKIVQIRPAMPNQ